MIPVRVPADTETYVARDDLRLTEDHPLYDEECPVCDWELGGDPVALVYVGVHSVDRKDRGWMTGAAVAVHARCTGRPNPDEEEAP